VRRLWAVALLAGSSGFSDESALEVAPPDRRPDSRPTAFTTMRYINRRSLPSLSLSLKEERKNRRLTATTSRIRRHAPFEPIDPNICMWGGVADLINCAKFFENPSKGFGAVRPRKIAFPIEIVHRPYNYSVGTIVSHCDKNTDSTKRGPN